MPRPMLVRGPDTVRIVGMSTTPISYPSVRRFGGTRWDERVAHDDRQGAGGHQAYEHGPSTFQRATRAMPNRPLSASLGRGPSRLTPDAASKLARVSTLP